MLELSAHFSEHLLSLQQLARGFLPHHVEFPIEEACSASAFEASTLLCSASAVEWRSSFCVEVCYLLFAFDILNIPVGDTAWNIL